MIVEDDLRLAALIRKGLTEEGFRVEVTGSATKGLELAVSKQYDAILLDLRLPGRKGFALLRALRRQGSAVPVMILTALSSVDDRVEGLDLGADDYMTKPFDLHELLARLRAIRRRPATPPRTVLRVADLELDTVRRSVTRRGRRIELTAKEFALLEYLLRNKENVVTRAMIVDHVWDLESQPRSNLVEVCINYLRTKVDEPFDRKLIHTSRGTGYVVREPNPVILTPR